MAAPETEARREQIEKKYAGKILIVGVDDFDPFKGIDLKCQAVEALLRQHPEMIGKIVLVQVANPARIVNKDSIEMRDQVRLLSVLRQRIWVGRHKRTRVLLSLSNLTVFKTHLFISQMTTSFSSLRVFSSKRPKLFVRKRVPALMTRYCVAGRCWRRSPA